MCWLIFRKHKNTFIPFIIDLNHYRFVVDWTHRDNFYWNWNRNKINSSRKYILKCHLILIQENAFENVICKMAAILFRPQCDMLSCHYDPVLYSLSVKTSYRQILWSLKATRLGVIMIKSFWNLTGISAALLPRCLSNIRVIEKAKTPILPLWGFTRSCCKTSICLVNRGPDKHAVGIPL